MAKECSQCGHWWSNYFTLCPHCKSVLSFRHSRLKKKFPEDRLYIPAKEREVLLIVQEE